MRSWQYEIGDVLIIDRKGVEVVARVAGYVDSLDDTTPLYVNLRVYDGQRWSRSKIKVQPDQIQREDKEWQAREHAKWEASIKATADAAYTRMTPLQKKNLREQTQRRRNRSPLDIMIDRACNLD